MPQTHDIGQTFWHWVRLKKDAPRHHTFDTFEVEEPFRWASPAHVYRLVGRLGIVVGKWRPSAWSEEEHHLIATQGKFVNGDVKGEGGESIEEHRQRRMDDAAVPEGWTVVPL